MEGKVFRVQQKLEGTHSYHTNYPLLPGDILIEEDGGTFYKSAPGLGITGFVLTDEQRATLEALDKHPPITFL